MRRLSIVVLSSTIAACGGSQPPSPPIVNPPSGGETINGTERIGWEQAAADAVELAAIRYAIYIDNTRAELSGVACTPSTGAARFACTARLPTLTAGAHTLQLASFVVDGALLESARSGALPVTVVSIAGPLTAAPSIRPGEVRAGDGSHGRVDLVAGDLAQPIDMAVAADGRLFVAERGGRICIVGDAPRGIEAAASLQTALGDLQLVALALDPEFARTHFVYVLYVSRSRGGEPTFSLVRLREVAGTFGDPVPLLDGVAASSSPAGALRFGPDAKLYAAFEAAADAGRAADRAAPNGKILRLNPDGTTPADQPGGTPVIASGLSAPSGLAWSTSSGTLWVADRGTDGRAQLRMIDGQTSVAFALPADVTPTGVAMTRSVSAATPVDALLVASDGDARLLRVVLDPRAGRPSTTERLIGDRADAVRAIAVAPDGAIYFATSNSIGRMVADPR